VTTFLALYRGQSVASAELVALSANHQIVEDFVARLLEESEPDQKELDERFHAGAGRDR